MFKFVKICFVAYHVINLGKGSVCTWEECVPCCCGMTRFKIYLLGPLDTKYSVSPMFSFWIPSELSIYCWKYAIEFFTAAMLSSTRLSHPLVFAKFSSLFQRQVSIYLQLLHLLRPWCHYNDTDNFLFTIFDWKSLCPI